ncbi:hypothetical protein ACWF94_28515 [Streptomyces sp. NPDC055078]
MVAFQIAVAMHFEDKLIERERLPAFSLHFVDRDSRWQPFVMIGRTADGALGGAAGRAAGGMIDGVLGRAVAGTVARAVGESVGGAVCGMRKG